MQFSSPQASRPPMRPLSGQARPIQPPSQGTPYGSPISVDDANARRQQFDANRSMYPAQPAFTPRPIGGTSGAYADAGAPSVPTRQSPPDYERALRDQQYFDAKQARRWFIDNRGKFPDVYRATLPALGQPYDQVQHYQAMQAAIRPMRAAYDRELAAYRKSLAPWMPAQVRPGGNAPYRPPPRTPSGELIPAPQMPDSLKNSPFSPFYQR